MRFRAPPATADRESGSSRSRGATYRWPVCGSTRGAAGALVTTRNELCADDGARSAGDGMRSGTARITRSKIHIRSRSSKGGSAYRFVERLSALDVFEGDAPRCAKCYSRKASRQANRPPDDVRGRRSSSFSRRRKPRASRQRASARGCRRRVERADEFVVVQPTAKHECRSCNPE